MAADGGRLVRRWLPWIGVLILLLAVAWGLWPKPVEVETALATKRPLTVQVSEEGKTRIRNRYVVTAPVAGTMERVLLKAGDPVVAGDTVLTRVLPLEVPLLDPRSHAQAKAGLALAQARRQQAEMAVEAAKQAADFASAERARVQSLSEGGGYSRSVRERIDADASIRQAELRAAEFAMQVAVAEEQRAAALLDRPQDPGADNRVMVTSPVSGVVLSVLQESATPVSPGTPILQVGDPADLEVEAEILSRDAVGIHEGDPVSIEQWGGEVALKGRVRRVEPAAFTKISALGVEEQRVRVLTDLIDPPASAKALGDQFRVEVRVTVWQADEVLTVPSGALFRQGNAWKVFQRDGGTARAVGVEVGQSDGYHTQILSGLNAGDEVLVHPPDTVADGVSVKKRS